MSLPQLQQGDKEQLQFEELRFPVGERLRLEVRSPKARYSVFYVGHVQNQTLILSMPVKNGKVQPIPDGSPVTIRFIASNRACAFTARVQRHQLKPFPMLCISYPSSVEAVMIRKTPRVQSRLIVSLDEVEEGILGGGWPRQAVCSDISLHGARIESGDLLAEVDEQFLMTARMKVGEVDQLLLSRCVVRNLEDFEDPFSGEYRVIHGVEFMDMDEETRLTLSGFVYQQMLKELGAL
ncbi:MAG: flagellar brake protein [Motiliproteus sp.]|nr:flagellar brake protein [Motiliproteus sp.]MCW9053021.1 flagellar brake protein [Motiliproteus sp.]